MDARPDPLRDAAYALVGLSVVWFQKAQVARRQLVKDLPALGGQVAGAAKGVAGMVKSVLDGTVPPAR